VVGDVADGVAGGIFERGAGDGEAAAVGPVVDTCAIGAHAHVLDTLRNMYAAATGGVAFDWGERMSS